MTHLTAHDGTTMGWVGQADKVARISVLNALCALVTLHLLQLCRRKDRLPVAGLVTG